MHYDERRPFAIGHKATVTSFRQNWRRLFIKEKQMAYLYLTIAIIAEVIATNALKASEEFTKFFPSIIVIIGYGAAIYFLSLVLKVIPVGIAYAIWAGMGIVLVAIVAAISFKQIPDWPAIIGMTMIIMGVVIINVFSKSVSH